MSEACRYEALCRAELRLEYLHANSTTHDFLFGAVAELIDNSRDAGATRLDIFTVNNENLQGGFMLCFLDDGCGMTPRQVTDIVYFGRSSKRTVSKMIGHFGNGLKSGSMRIGKDFILFTKKESTMTCLLFSQTFCETEGLTEVIVPILSWSSCTREPIMDIPDKFATQLSIISKYSPFKSEAELIKRFDTIYGERGTLVVIYNLKLMLNGEPELDVQTDEADMLIAGALENLPEQRSLRAYAAILYLDPRMKIFIQAKKVETKRLPYCFYRPRKYLYTSPLKEIATHKPQTAEMEVNCAEHAGKEVEGKQKHLQDSLWHEGSEVETKVAQVAVWDAMENKKRMRGKVQDTQRNLKKTKTLCLIFGINIQDRNRDGMLIYSNSRLIRMFEKVGPQKKPASCLGAGAVGMVDVPLEIMEPTHNKQSFAHVKQYNHLLKSMGCYLVQYWKDIGISQKGEMFFWNDFGYTGAKWNEKPLDTIPYRRRRAVEIPDIVQCDLCLKWRLLSLDTDINNKHHDIWVCEENKCHIPEHLPSIPLGTFLSSSWSLNDKAKLLIDSIQQPQRKLKNTKCILVQPHSIVQHTEDRRTAKDKNENIKTTVCLEKAFHKDPSPACGSLIKNRANKRRAQNLSFQKQPPAKQEIHSLRKWHPHQEEKYRPSEPDDRMVHNMSMLLPLEVQDEQSLNEKPEIIKIKTDSETETIIIISDSESDNLPIYEECKDFIFIAKEKQEQQDEKTDLQLDWKACITAEKTYFCRMDSESGSIEEYKEGNKEQTLAGVRAPGAAVPQAQELSENKMIEILTERIKEILVYFLPECSISREHLTCMSTEDILSMFKEEHSEQNKDVPLDIIQYFSQCDRRISEKRQSIFLEIEHAIETKISLCEVQVKTAQERLNHLREKMLQLLLKIHPHLLINNLVDIDGYLEEIQKEEHINTFVSTNTSSVSE